MNTGYGKAGVENEIHSALQLNLFARNAADEQ